MRIKHVISESAKHDVEVLNNIIDIIIERIPKTIEKDSHIIIPYYELRQLYTLPENISEKYEIYYEILLEHTSYHIRNYKKDLNGKVAGEFKEGFESNIIHINIPALIDKFETISKDELLNFKDDNKALKTFRSTLLHEMRHAIQNEEYTEFYHHSAETYPYENDPVEIDAAWLHHLNDFDVSDFSTVKDYVDHVMKSFSAYKYLDKKQKEHYRRKTARYYYDNISRNSNNDDIETRKNKKIMSYIENDKDSIIKAFDSMKDDLREYGHPETQRFLLPKDRIRPLLHKSLNDPESVSNNNQIYIVFSILSLIHEHYQFNTKYIEKYFNSQFKLNSKTVIDIIKQNGIGPFDAQFFIDNIKEVFK